MSPTLGFQGVRPALHALRPRGMGPTAMTSTCVGVPIARTALRVSTRLWPPEVQPDRMADLPEPESSVNRETHRGELEGADSVSPPPRLEERRLRDGRPESPSACLRNGSHGEDAGHSGVQEQGRGGYGHPVLVRDVAGVEILAGPESYASLQRDKVLVEPLGELRAERSDACPCSKRLEILDRRHQQTRYLR